MALFISENNILTCHQESGDKTGDTLEEKAMEIVNELREIDFRNVFEPTTRIGAARFDDETSCIFIEVFPGYEYEVDLKKCKTAGACLNWIHQIGAKTWGREVIGDFQAVLFLNIPVCLWSGK
jgi:hypothetical protein